MRVTAWLLGLFKGGTLITRGNDLLVTGLLVTGTEVKKPKRTMLTVSRDYAPSLWTPGRDSQKPPCLSKG